MAIIDYFRSSTVLAIVTVLGCSLYVVGLVVYRIYLSPLANIPGPKLAAATLWYQFYYDVIQAGRYTWKIRELHDIYGKPQRSSARFTPIGSVLQDQLSESTLMRSTSTTPNSSTYSILGQATNAKNGRGQ